jgi:hypothetical protein
MRKHEDAEGFAVPAALLALVIVGAVITGGFFIASQASLTSGSADRSRQAFYAAEQGIQQVLGTWTRADFEALGSAPDTVTGYVATSANDTTGRYVAEVRRLDQELYLITATGYSQSRDWRNDAARKLAEVVRTQVWNVPANGALYVFGGVSVKGTALISGEDADNGSCNSTGSAAVPGITTSDSSLVKGTIASGPDASKGIWGDPPVLEDTTLNASSLLNYGDVTFDALAGQADVTLSGGTLTGIGPSTTGGSCDTGASTNWGDPLYTGQPCSSYFPIVYSSGDLHISTGNGQGVLLVAGNLQISGNFTFDGVVIVKGSMSTSGNGNHVNGVVIVNSDSVALDATASSSTGSSVLQYSSCSAQKALSGHERAEPIVSRSWFDLSAAGASTQ